MPQNIRDESASELLGRIKKEKAQLVKEGKLKKEKLLPPIPEDEIPYDLPDGWASCRLGELITLISGRDLETRQFNAENLGIPYITGASSIDNDKILITRWTNESSVVSVIGDLLISCKGTVGKIVFNTIGNCHIARQIMGLRFWCEQINKNFVRIFLQSHVQQLLIQAKSMIPGISRDNILTAMIPLPPLAEQQRIVAKVDELMALCDELKTARMFAVTASIISNVVPFPQQDEDDEEIGMAARGDIEGLPKEALEDIALLFGDEGNA